MNMWVYVGETRVEGADAVIALAMGRGQAYGDGVFETMRASDGQILWWPAHWQRFAEGARRLRIVLPRQVVIETEIADLLRGVGDTTIKLTLCRGAGGRGYAPANDAPPLWLLSTHPLPSPQRAGGLVLRWCETLMAVQPLLAGLKHCNRLEQVLARAEWDDPGIDEGLLREQESGDVIGATAANLFVLREHRWWTPPVDRCGIAGVCRDWALSALNAGERRLTVSDVETADALFLCNALRGILPVVRLGDRRWAPHPAMADAVRRLSAAHPALAPAIRQVGGELSADLIGAGRVDVPSP
ncbi:MAG: aminodeoxychorismate lyase [Lysobacteraceae bacterium]|nr:MAG: aminodeoxychorismate lyase [Xanthomonadaceae bacterium]